MRAALCLSVFTAVGCVPTFDDNLPLIEQPTLLSIASEPAEATPGKEVQLSALVGVPRVDGAAPQVDWGLCVARKPLTELGPVNPVCIQPPVKAPKAGMIKRCPSVTKQGRRTPRA